MHSCMAFGMNKLNSSLWFDESMWYDTANQTYGCIGFGSHTIVYVYRTPPNHIINKCLMLAYKT